MDFFIGVTDNDWFYFLRERAPLDEVDFWLPSARQGFGAVQVGEPFLFKLHAPQNYIVGGGFYTHFSRSPVYMAWEAFGEKTGMGSYQSLRERIAAYRRDDDPQADFEIGNVMLTDPFFLEDEDWITAPSDWSSNIVRGKRYSTAEGEGALIWSQVLERLAAIEREKRDLAIADPQSEVDGPIYGEPVPVRRRLGQGSFRMLVTDAYSRRCAVTGERALPTLDAAHIMPVAGQGRHRIDNGLLLRSDVHRLFDSGYVTVTPELRFRVSERLRTDFQNGEPYFPYHGSEIAVPEREVDRPDRVFLEWHSDTVFRG